MALPDVLVSASFGTALDAVNRALRVLRFRDGADHMLAYLRSDQDDPASGIALEIIETVEGEEGRTIATLDDATADRHIEELSKFVDERTRREWRRDESAGRAALSRLRSEQA
jgi:hypothetical protein